MIIQSLSIVVPTHGCMNQCKFCVSRMRKDGYEDYISLDQVAFRESYKNRMAFARDNGCNTVMLTGQGEPQQNVKFLDEFAKMNSELAMPFRNIEIQTTGAGFTEANFTQLNNIGVTTVSVSVSCLNNDYYNSDIINGGHTFIQLANICDSVKRHGMNLRLSLNMTKWLCLTLDKKPTETPNIPLIFDTCKELGADQVTFRKMFYNEDDNSSQTKWIKENNVKPIFFLTLNQFIRVNGKYLDTLEYGSDRYSVNEMSVVVDDDCMAKKEEKKALKYLVLRPNCKLYSKWDDKGSLVF